VSSIAQLLILEYLCWKSWNWLWKNECTVRYNCTVLFLMLIITLGIKSGLMGDNCLTRRNHHADFFMSLCKLTISYTIDIYSQILLIYTRIVTWYLIAYWGNFREIPRDLLQINCFFTINSMQTEERKELQISFWGLILIFPRKRRCFLYTHSAQHCKFICNCSPNTVELTFCRTNVESKQL